MCEEHGVRQIDVPWAEAGSRLTALFEALVIDWLNEARISAVARMVDLSWDQVDGVMQRAVARGLARREARLPRKISSFRPEDQRLSKTRYLWLQNPANISDERWVKFEPLRASNLKTARARALKETAMQLWHYTSRTWAKKGWMRWYGWAIRSRLEPMKEVARMIKDHLDGVITAVVKAATNARAESINSVVQWLKYTARGFRNRERFKWAIYFHLGGLDLYPAGIVK